MDAPQIGPANIASSRTTDPMANSRVQMRTRNLSKTIDHRHDDEPESDGDAYMCNRTSCLSVNDHSPRATKDQRECSYYF